MNLGLLKKALSRFPTDMDDLHVVFKVIPKKEEASYFALAGVGYIESPECIVLIDEKSAEEEINKTK